MNPGKRNTARLGPLSLFLVSLSILLQATIPADGAEPPNRNELEKKVLSVFLETAADAREDIKLRFRAMAQAYYFDFEGILPRIGGSISSSAIGLNGVAEVPCL